MSINPSDRMKNIPTQYINPVVFILHLQKKSIKIFFLLTLPDTLLTLEVIIKLYSHFQCWGNLLLVVVH